MSIAAIDTGIAAAAQAPCLICRGKGRLTLSTGAQVPCQLCEAPDTADTTDTRCKLMGDARNAVAALPALVHDLRALGSIADTVAHAIPDPFSPAAVAAAAQAWSPADPLVMEMRYANEAAQNRRNAAERTVGTARAAVVNAIATQVGRILPALYIDAPVPAWLGLEEREYMAAADAMQQALRAQMQDLGTRWRTMRPAPEPKCLPCEPDCGFCGGQGCPRYEW